MTARRNLETGKRLLLLEDHEDETTAMLDEHGQTLQTLLCRVHLLTDLLGDSLALHYHDQPSDRVEAARAFQKKIDAAFHLPE